MKIILPLLTLLLLSGIFLAGCQSTGSEPVDEAQLMDTVITEIRDTVITFYPETYEEVVNVVVSYDTMITPRTPVQ